MFPAQVFIMSKLGLSFIMWFLLLGTARADITIVTSIEPLALISRSIVGEHGQVTTLVDARQSAHDYSMRPSDRIAIQRASLLVWVDPQFEVYLADIFATQARQKAVVAFAELDNVNLIHERSGELDPHMWLDTRNARVLAAAISQSAQQLDPDNAIHFQSNLESLQKELDAAEQQIQLLLAEPAKKPYGVYHNAYQYFENQFGLDGAVNLLRNPEIQPSGQEIIRVRRTVQELELGCVMLEFDSNMAVVNTMLNGVEVQRPIVDIMGSDLPAGTGRYVDLLTKMAQQFADCVY